ncbi:MAG: mevalonate kinase [Thermoplasmata archaeon]|nr:mevalonate kinase [Thermoplasmata archaeon]
MGAWHTASAPGKFVILGEHSVVYGKPAVTLAVDLRMTVAVRRSGWNTMNGDRLDFRRQAHIRYLTRNLRHAVDMLTYSEIPVGSGMGSSAALSAAMAMALASESGEQLSEEQVMREAYEAEYYAQGNGSPMDASTCVHGGGVSINMPEPDGEFLWKVERNGRSWSFNDLKAPEMTFVIGNTGIRAPTGPQVDKVHRYMDRSHFAREVIDDIADVTVEGGKALKNRDVEALGRLMTKDHKLLSILGVSCDALNKLVNASLPYSYGAKLTGSGGGGCMVALTDRPEKVCEAIESRGGTPYVVRTGGPGVMMEPNPPERTGLRR